MNQAITARICEAESRGDPELAIAPDTGDDLDLFPLQDPFGLRKAIVPVLLNDVDGVTKGMGTAFHVDGWGTFLTADHVINSVRKRTKQIASSGGEEIRLEIPHPDICPILLLGIGIVFGQPGVPSEALALVEKIRSPIRERESVFSMFSERAEIEAALDIAVMHLAKPVPEKMIGTLAVRFSGRLPKIGDIVVAVGFPDLDCNPIDDGGMHYLLSDGMSAAYGRVSGIHRNGVLKDPTPVIEITANWPGGMSGGPVFNDRGEVIAVVSHSWTPSEGNSGTGYAACLSMIPWLRQQLSTVDFANPGSRCGWAVMRNGEDLVSFHKREAEATEHKRSLGEDYIVAFGSNPIGSDDFIAR